MQAWRQGKGFAPCWQLPVFVSLTLPPRLLPSSASSFLQQHWSPVCSLSNAHRTSLIPPPETLATAKQAPAPQQSVGSQPYGSSPLGSETPMPAKQHPSSVLGVLYRKVCPTKLRDINTSQTATSSQSLGCQPPGDSPLSRHQNQECFQKSFSSQKSI